MQLVFVIFAATPTLSASTTLASSASTESNNSRQKSHNFPHNSNKIVKFKFKHAGLRVRPEQQPAPPPRVGEEPQERGEVLLGALCTQELQGEAHVPGGEDFHGVSAF